MREFDGKIFAGRSEAPQISDVRADNCDFNGCHLMSSKASGDWNVVRNIELNNASQMNCSVDLTAIEEVTVRNLKRTGEAPLFLWGCVFKHVKLVGRISGIKINRSTGIGRGLKEQQPKWDEAVRRYYCDLDWALDISEAKFGGGITFEAVPGHLIRRDPARQALIRRAALQGRDWRALDYDGTALDYGLSWFEQDSLFDSVVLAARADSKWRKRDEAVLAMLRSEGIAEPD